MTTPRRRTVRPPTSDPQRQLRQQRLRAQLAKERTSLARWQKRLKRAFNSTQKHQARIARLERQLAHLEK
jgi:septal ring factor EnvC (AmiA/AmiB activator)